MCERPLKNISRLPVCRECLSGVKRISGRLCSVCGERLADNALGLAASQEGTFLCEPCQVKAPVYDKAVAFGSYEGGLRDLIHLLKFKDVRSAAPALGGMLNEAISGLAALSPADSVMVLPVPLHRRKQRQRGFNQAELIVRAALKRKTFSRFELRTDLLQRSRETASQIGLSDEQRRENLRGAFLVRNPAQIAGRAILLVDDVFTTGTTVSECARVLRRAGASTIWVATVGRTFKRNAQSLGIEASWNDDLATVAEA